MAQHDLDVVPRSRPGALGLLALTALFAAVTSGCSDASSGDAPIIRQGTLLATPADGATNVDVDAIGLFFDSSSSVTETDLETIASRMALRTWPEEAIVASTIEDAPHPYSDGPGFRLVPSTPLEERWYSMEVTNLRDDGIAWRWG